MRSTHTLTDHTGSSVQIVTTVICPCCQLHNYRYLGNDMQHDYYITKAPIGNVYNIVIINADTQLYLAQYTVLANEYNALNINGHCYIGCLPYPNNLPPHTDTEEVLDNYIRGIYCNITGIELLDHTEEANLYGTLAMVPSSIYWNIETRAKSIS